MRANFTQYDNEDLRQKDRDHNIHPLDRLRNLQGGRLRGHGRGRGRLRLQRRGRALHGRHRRAVVRQPSATAGDEMAQAIADQVRRIPYYSTFTHLTTPPAAELAAKLAEISPASINHVFYGTGGSMANDTAIRVIHFYFNRLGKPNKKKIISRVDAYHGSTYLAMTMTGREGQPRGLRPRARHGAPHPRAPHLPAAGRHECRGLLRREGRRPREQDPGARAGERRLLHRRAGSWAAAG